MPGQPIVAGAVLTAGLRAEFADTYQQTYEAQKSRLADCMQLGLPAMGAEEILAYFESAPYPRRWPRGETISSKAMKSRQFRVQVFDYGRRIEWHENDRADDRTKTLYEQARMLGQHFATLPERIFFQLLQSTVDPDLLPAIPNAPDGVSLFSATDGTGAARFGVTGGNIVATGGVASSFAIRDKFFASISRFRKFQDTEGQPLWSDYLMDGGYMVIYGAHNELYMREAFRQSLTSSTAPAAGSVAATNIILESGLKVDLWPTQRITDDKYYIALKAAPKKALFQMLRQPLREAYATVDTSDQVRDTKQEYIQFDERAAYGVALPYQVIQVA